jgi:hypothetical protein
MHTDQVFAAVALAAYLLAAWRVGAALRWQWREMEDHGL